MNPFIITTSLILYGFTLFCCQSCSPQISKEDFVKVSKSDILNLEPGKLINWSNSDSSVIMRYMFKDLDFLADYVMYAAIEVRHVLDTAYYLREIEPSEDTVVRGDSLYILSKANTSIKGWHEVHKYGSHRMDYDTVQWLKTLSERKDIAYQHAKIDSLPYGTYKLQGSDLMKVKLTDNPFVNRDKDIYGIFYVTEPGTGPAYLLNMDSVSSLLLSPNPPKKIKTIYIKD
ncbi:hypothetical protein [Sphingobacterium faecale]|uniref:DUF3298 domain-containing protein n=1 Tax=Sphingobacterium faecale TaxID=2803775 RepID=A0ABS1RA40_9SPHI|nr:hypothetical protein [Sphingobacterium faecale]MBL1411084.1 hypothetical protein [Sphingobacterium faecale]